MTFSEELKMLSFRENPSIEKVRAILTSAARNGEVFASIEFDDLDILAVESYLKSQGFKVNSNLETEHFYISWA
jgi:hypothetical protein